MLIQLGFLLCDMINWQPVDKNRDNKLENIKYFQNNVKAIIEREKIGLNEKYKDNQDTKESKIAKKSIYDEKIMLDVLNNIEEKLFKIWKSKNLN